MEKIMTQGNTSAKISLVFAFAYHQAKKIIGDRDGLLWHLAEDLKNFKKITLGHVVKHDAGTLAIGATPAVIMGRKTWDSLPRKPLPHRHNIIISWQKNLSLPEGTHLFSDMNQAIAHCRTKGWTTAVIGGAQIFAEAYPLADIIYASELLGENILDRQPVEPCYLDIPYEQDYKLVEEVDFPQAAIPFIVREYHRKDSQFAPQVKKLLG